MANPGVPIEELKRRYDVWLACGRSYRKAAGKLGVERSSLRMSVSRYESEVLQADNPATAILPDFGDDDIPVEQIIEQQCERYEARKAHHSAHDFFPIAIRGKDPILLAFMGDPHVDADGCNWPLLKRDCEILRETPGAYAVNIGDAHNNWAGRLMHLYAAQETSKKTAYKLVNWLLRESGVNWLFWLAGNHDAWGDGMAVLYEMSRGAAPVFDWQAKFELVFENGRRCPVHAAHSFKGTSIYNPGHGMLRAAKFSQHCPRIYAQGHHHEYYMHHAVYEDLDLTYWGMKVRGYKWIDHYADVLQFGSNSYGATGAFVIDPRVPEEDPGFIRGFDDLAMAAQFLEFLKERPAG
jgi:hypothetical protein